MSSSSGIVVWKWNSCKFNNYHSCKNWEVFFQKISMVSVFHKSSIFGLQFSTSLWFLVFQKIKVGIAKQRELHILTFWTDAIIYQVFIFVFIQSSFILIGGPAGVFAVYSFFRWVKFSFPRATCKLTCTLPFWLGETYWLTRNPHSTKIFTYSRNLKSFKFF